MRVKCYVILNCLLLGGCLSERKAEKIKSAAVNEFVKANPCNNDSTFLAGGSDTAIVYDTVYIADEPESVIVPYHGDNMPPEAFQFYPLIDSSKLSRQIKYITKTVRIKDTVKIVTVDKRQINLLTEQVRNSQIANSVTQISASEWKSKARTRFWILIAIAALLTCYGGFRWWAKIKSVGIKGLTI